MLIECIHLFGTYEYRPTVNKTEGVKYVKLHSAVMIIWKFAHNIIFYVI